MELINRYIAAVQRELPDNKREDIGRELHANIMDQVDALSEQKAEQGAELNEADLIELLQELGHPRHVALQFSPPKAFISGQHKALYLHTLSVALIIMFMLALIQTTGRWLDAQSTNFIALVFAVGERFLDQALLVFTAITLIFAAISAQESANKSGANQKEWNPRTLPAVEQKWSSISLQDSFTDLGTYVFLLVLIWYPMSPFGSLENSLFTEQALNILKVFSLFIVLGVGLSVWQLFTRLWSKPMLTLSVVVNVAFFAVFAWLALFVPVLESSSFAWSAFIDSESFQKSFRITLLIIALFPGYEAMRDSMRIRQLRSSTG